MKLLIETCFEMLAANEKKQVLGRKTRSFTLGESPMFVYNMKQKGERMERDKGMSQKLVVHP